MALQLSSHIEREVIRARVSLILSPQRLADILPDAPGEGVAEIEQYSSLFPKFRPDLSARNDVLRAALSPVVPNTGLSGASNAWAAAPVRSAKRGSLLATDPHLGLSAPVGNLPCAHRLIFRFGHWRNDTRNARRHHWTLR